MHACQWATVEFEALHGPALCGKILIVKQVSIRAVTIICPIFSKCMHMLAPEAHDWP